MEIFDYPEPQRLLPNELLTTAEDFYTSGDVGAALFYAKIAKEELMKLSPGVKYVNMWGKKREFKYTTSGIMKGIDMAEMLMMDALRTIKDSLERKLLIQPVRELDLDTLADILGKKSKAAQTARKLTERYDTECLYLPGIMTHPL